MAATTRSHFEEKLQLMPDNEEPTYYAKLRQFETELINEALRRARGNQAQAARMLGLAPTTLSSQLRRLGIQAKTFKRRDLITSFHTFQRFLLEEGCQTRIGTARLKV
jgi:transcriptional regulator with GAF, ATPase, and Fis domain